MRGSDWLGGVEGWGPLEAGAKDQSRDPLEAGPPMEDPWQQSAWEQTENQWLENLWQESDSAGPSTEGRYWGAGAEAKTWAWAWVGAVGEAVPPWLSTKTLSRLSTTKKSSVAPGAFCNKDWKNSFPLKAYTTSNIFIRCPLKPPSSQQTVL